MMPLARWHRGFVPDDNRHPWASRTCADILDEVPDRIARQFLKVSAHSDMATEPHLTSGLIGLRNFLKAVPGYGAQYTIEGGMEMLPRHLAAESDPHARRARLDGRAGVRALATTVIS